MKLGVYGGAFNPVHYGHLRTAEEVRERLALNKVIFMPAGKTPFDKPSLAPATDRYEMVKKAIRGNRYFTVSDIELKSRGRSYTINTARKLNSQYKDDDIFFILGIDAFLDLPYWKQPDKLISAVNIVVISRPGFRFEDLSASPFLGGISVRTLRDLDKGRKSDFMYRVGDKDIIFCNVTAMNISASNIRDMIKRGENIKYLLPDSVKFYIISHNLYLN